MAQERQHAKDGEGHHQSAAFNVIPFKRPQPQSAPSVKWRPRPLVLEAATEFGRNRQIRFARRSGWYSALVRVCYWRAQLDLVSAIERLHRRDLPEGHFHGPIERNEREKILAKYREALSKQFLTPAYSLDCVRWKQSALSARKHAYTGLSEDRIKSAIEDDHEFLASHPLRRRG